MDWTLGSFGRWLHKAEDIPIPIADIKFRAVRSLPQRDGECHFRGREGLENCRGIPNDDAGVQVLTAFESRLVTLRRRSALEMNSAAVATNACIKVFVVELELESELPAIECERPRQIPDPENRRDVAEASRRLVHSIRCSVVRPRRPPANCRCHRYFQLPPCRARASSYPPWASG